MHFQGGAAGRPIISPAKGANYVKVCGAYREEIVKCFKHPENEAVGSCKYCFRGVCPQCARDSGVGLACSETCQAEIKSVHALVERNKKLTTFAPEHIPEAL